MVRPRVVVVGSVNEDLVTKLPRLPSPGETVGGGTFSRNLGGKGANQAVAAARLGAEVRMIGAVGRDDAGRRSVKALRDAGVAVEHMGVVDVPTGTAQILVDSHGENMIAVAAGANAALDGNAVLKAFDAIDLAGCVVLANLEVPDAAVEVAAQAAAQRGAQFVLNPAPARRLGPRLAVPGSILVPNRHEVELLGLSQQALLDAGLVLVVTQGVEGATLLREGRPPVHQPAFRVDAVDATGAGDAFCAALVWALAGGDDLEQALQYAAAAGALATLEVGAQSSLPTPDALKSFMGEWASADSPAIPWARDPLLSGG